MKSKTNITSFEYAKENSSWHFDPSIESNDIIFHDHFDFDKKEVQKFIAQIENSGKLKKIVLGKRTMQYDNNKFYQIDELILSGYNERMEFMESIDLSLDDKKSTFLRVLVDSLNLSNPKATLMIQRPGQMLPLHCDYYNSYRQNKNINSPSDVKRFLVALSDWDWGHYFLCGNTVWKQWKLGDCIHWKYLMYHCSANCGFKNKITLSITGH